MPLIITQIFGQGAPVCARYSSTPTPKREKFFFRVLISALIIFRQLTIFSFSLAKITSPTCGAARKALSVSDPQSIMYALKFCAGLWRMSE